MPAVINSAPDCVTSGDGFVNEDDLDFILQANFQDCVDKTGGGFMTFGPGSTYGPEGQAADTAYYILTWLGITVMVLALIAWVVFENRRLIAYHAAKLGGAVPRGETSARWRR